MLTLTRRSNRRRYESADDQSKSILGQPIQARVQAREGEQVGPRPERCIAVAIDTDDLGGDPLADLGFVAWLGQDRRGRNASGYR